MKSRRFYQKAKKKHDELSIETKSKPPFQRRKTRKIMSTVLAGSAEERTGVLPPLPQGAQVFPPARSPYVLGLVGAGGHVRRGDGGGIGMRHGRAGRAPGVLLPCSRPA